MPGETKFEFFYDCSSPWTYFAFERVIPLARELGQDICWRPILVGGVFNQVNQQIYAARESMFSNERRMTYYSKDMQDWSELIGIKVDHPDVFPVNSVKAMRGAFFAQEQDLIEPYSRALFRAYWGENRDISQDSELSDICQQVGIDWADFKSAISEPLYKEKLRANVDELVARGGYGSPTMFINESDMYFGNDRLPLVEHKLKQLLGK